MRLARMVALGAAHRPWRRDQGRDGRGAGLRANAGCRGGMIGFPASERIQSPRTPC